MNIHARILVSIYIVTKINQSTVNSPLMEKEKPISSPTVLGSLCLQKWAFAIRHILAFKAIYIGPGSTGRE